MNRRSHQPSRKRGRALTGVLEALAWGLVCSSCVPIEGGAVELSWTLQDFDGAANSCEASGIAEVRICWQSLGDAAPPSAPKCATASADPGGPEPFRAFPCAQHRGASQFVIPAQRTAFFVQPMCPDNEAPRRGTYLVPPPIVRAVQEGRVVTLNQLRMVAHRERCGECTCPMPL